jgi:hypothetical protein
MRKTSGKYDFKIFNLISNIKIIELQQLTIHLDYPSSPYETFKVEKNNGNPQKLRESQKSFKNS